MIKEAVETLKDIIPKNVNVRLDSHERIKYMLINDCKEAKELPLAGIDFDKADKETMTLILNLYCSTFESFVQTVEGILPYVDPHVTFNEDMGQISAKSFSKGKDIFIDNKKIIYGQAIFAIFKNSI
jgi:hypothetical protein